MIIKLMNVATYGHNLNYTALPTFGMKNLSNIATHNTSKCVVIYNEYMRNYCMCTCSSSLVCMYPYSLLSTIRYHLIVYPNTTKHASIHSYIAYNVSFTYRISDQLSVSAQFDINILDISRGQNFHISTPLMNS